MDGIRPIWQRDPVQRAREAGDLGAIVRSVRKANLLTLAELAAQCGYSASSLSRMERGKQQISDVRVLRTLAAALRIPPQVLGLVDTPRRCVSSGQGPASVGATLAPIEESDPMRRRTLLAGLTGLAGTAALGTRPAAAAVDPATMLEAALLDPTAMSGPAMAISRLRQNVDSARLLFQHGEYTRVAAALPSVLATATASREEAADADLELANSALADVYTLATDLMVKLGHDHLATTTADRALQAAYATDDVLTLASARRASAIVLRRAGRNETAQRLVVDTATSLQPDLHRTPEHLSVYGSLLSTAAYTAAVDGDRDSARTLIREAAQLADRLGVDANYRFTAFGPTGVGLYRISIARVLGDHGTAVEVARRIDARSIPLEERRARYWSDVARSFHQWGKPEQCFRALLAAERVSVEEVRYRKPIQQITTDLLSHPRAGSLPGLRAFASRVGITT